MFSASKYNPFQAVPVALSRAQRLVRFFARESKTTPPATRRFYRRWAGDVLTDLELRRAIDTFKRTHRERTETDELIPSWRVLRSMDAESFTRGCRAYLRDGSPHFPKPSDIRRMGKAPPAYVEPSRYVAPWEENPDHPFDRARFRQMLRDRAGIDLDKPCPLTPSPHWMEE